MLFEAFDAFSARFVQLWRVAVSRSGQVQRCRPPPRCACVLAFARDLLSSVRCWLPTDHCCSCSCWNGGRSDMHALAVHLLARSRERTRCGLRCTRASSYSVASGHGWVHGCVRALIARTDYDRQIHQEVMCVVCRRARPAGDCTRGIEVLAPVESKHF